MGAHAAFGRMLAATEPLSRALSNVPSRERVAIEQEIVRRTAEDVAWARLNDRITAGLEQSRAADERALKRMEQSHV